jgi:hypothetical protein
VADAPSHQLFFARNVEIFELRSGGHDQGFGVMPIFIGHYGPEPILRFQTGNFRALKLRSLIRRLPLHSWTEIETRDAVGESRKVFDLLNADEMAAGNIAFQDECRQAIARGEKPGSEPGQTGTNYNNVIVGHVSLKVQIVQAVQVDQTPSFILPRVAGEERGGGLNGLNVWNGFPS